MSEVLTVTGLSADAGPIPLVRDISFTIGAGERVGLIGESGSGKTMTALAVTGLLPDGVRASGDVRLAGAAGNLLAMPDRSLKRLRGNAVSMVFQEPMTALNPVMRVVDQVAEVMLVHRTRPSRRAAREQAVALLERVRLPQPRQIARAYPHQLSGGQRQRVLIAIAIAGDPALLVCDEPTTALDVTVQRQMLALIDEVVAEWKSALLFITHDLTVVARMCKRVLVMYGGKIVEAGPTREVLGAPRHPYTRGLVAASDLTAVDERGRLGTIPGSVPAAGRFPSGCVFRSRCHGADEECVTEPDTVAEGGRILACWHPEEAP